MRQPSFNVHRRGNSFGIWPFRAWAERRDSRRRQTRRRSSRLQVQPLESRCVLSAAPVLDTAAAPALGSIFEDAEAPAGVVGTLVSSLIDAGGPLNNFSDADGDLPGIAITGTNLQGGTLWYSVDGGTSWLDVGTVSALAPRYLAANATSRMYFEPASNFSGTLADVISFKAWDRTGILQQIGADLDGEAAGDWSGTAVSLSADGRTVAIGARNNVDAGGLISGHVRVYRWSGTTWTQLGADVDGEAAYDQWGYSVSLSADGTTVAIGAVLNDGNGENSGQTRIYGWDGTAWGQLGADIDGEAASDESGYSVSLSADGTTVAIGSRLNDGNGDDSGHVRVFRWTGTDWSQLGGNIDGEAEYDQSGSSISLSADGTTVAIGAPYNNGMAAGHVRVYRWSSLGWSQLGGDLEGETAYDWSGSSVSLSADGATVAIGAPYNGGNGPNSGQARIYRWANDVWEQLGGDIDGEEADDHSYAVSLSADGRTVAIGAPYNDGSGSGSGHVRIYRWTGAGWSRLGTDLDGEAEADYAGFTLSMAADGSSVAVGAPGNDGNGSVAGQVRVYRLVPEADSVSAATDTVSLTVTDVNDAPTAVALTNTTTSLPENTSTATRMRVGDIVVTDDALGAETITLTGADAVAFEVDGLALFLRAGVALDFEAKASYAVTVSVADTSLAGSTPVTAGFTLAITDVNEQPTNVDLSTTTVPENVPWNTVVGTLSTSDVDPGETFTYALVSGAGDDDNWSFTIDGNELRVAVQPNFERWSSSSVRVRSTDSGGLSTEQPFTITVTDVDEAPIVDHVIAPIGGSFRAGQPIDFTAVLTQPVTRVGAGAATIPLVVGVARVNATLVGGLGTNRLSFRYVPQAVHNDSDGIALARPAIALPAGTSLRDAQGRRLSVALPSVAVGGIRIDNQAPLLRALAIPARGTYRPGDVLTFTATMSEPVNVTGTPALTLTIGNRARQATYVSGSGTSTLVFRYVVQPGDSAPRGITIAGRLVLAGGSILDLAGNRVTPTFTAPLATRVVVSPIPRPL